MCYAIIKGKAKANPRKTGAFADAPPMIKSLVAQPAIPGNGVAGRALFHLACAINMPLSCRCIIKSRDRRGAAERVRGEDVINA